MEEEEEEEEDEKERDRRAHPDASRVRGLGRRRSYRRPCAWFFYVRPVIDLRKALCQTITFFRKSMTRVCGLHRQRDAWLLEEVQRQADIQAAAAGRPKLKIAGRNIWWQWIAGQVRQLGLPDDQQAALFGVMAGDAVPEATAAR